MKKIVVFTVIWVGVSTGLLLISIGESVAEPETDTTPPTIESVSIYNSPIIVKVNFSEPVEQTSAETTSNYVIDHGIRIISAFLEDDQRTVTLTTSELSDSIPIPEGQIGDWNLLFRDEFDGNSLDQSKWTTCYWWWGHWVVGDGCTNEGTGELQFYQEDNVIVSNGTLKLQAREEEIITVDVYDDEVTYQYTSGIITTGRSVSDTNMPAKFLFKYGYAEIQAKIPSGHGLWPAFWTLPDDHNSTPEIDVVEFLGHTTDTARFHLHNNGVDPGSNYVGSDFSADFHTYAVDWQSDVIIWYVDGVERWRYDTVANIPAEDSYLLLNLAVGGDWPGSPDESTPFPIDYEIDYVRVWQKGENPSSEDVVYTLSVNNIRDRASNPNTILANTKKTIAFYDANSLLPPVNLRIELK